MTRDDRNDDTFDSDLRTTLEGIAREPVPDSLVSRVAQIPDREPARRPFLSRFGLGVPRLGPGFAAVLGVVVIGLAVVVVRPALDRGGAGATPSATPDSSAIAVVPTDSPEPTVSTTPVPSVNVPASVPPPSAVPTETPVVSVPGGFEPASVTFVSSVNGWVLGSVPCGSDLCPAVEVTTDGGHTWNQGTAPKSTFATGIGSDSSSTSGVARIRFATKDDGWTFGPDLWATHDGGVTWKPVSVPGGLPASSTVVALETSRGVVHAVFYDDVTQDFRIATSPIGSDAWELSAVKVAIGAGPVPMIQLVLSGGAGWLLENDRTVEGGARLVNGTWKAWTPACSGTAGPAYLAASSATDIVASCDVGEWSTPQGNHLFVSTNGGSSFAETGAQVPVLDGTGAATPGTSTIVVAGSSSSGSVLVASFDGGASWGSVLHVSSGELNDLGFTNSSQGVVVVTNFATGSGRLFMTRDGGHTWSNVEF